MSVVFLWLVFWGDKQCVSKEAAVCVDGWIVSKNNKQENFCEKK